MTLIARLVPIKRVDRFLRVAERLVAQRQGPALPRRRRRRAASDAAGEHRGERSEWPPDMGGLSSRHPRVCFASDAVVLTSDNEGTPVSLIEAQAAGTPVVGTQVGGVASVVRHGSTGFTVDPTDELGMARAVSRLLDAPRWLSGRQQRSAEFAQAFSLDALVSGSTSCIGDCSEDAAPAPCSAIERYSAAYVGMPTACNERWARADATQRPRAPSSSSISARASIAAR